MPRRDVSLVEFQPKPKNDAYTALLSISLVAMIGACLLLWFDLKSYPTLTPQAGAQPGARPVSQPAIEQPAVPAATPPAPGEKPM